MHGECYFCHGVVVDGEAGDIVLDRHADHDVFMHQQCAEGHNVFEESSGPSSEAAILCPRCGEVEVLAPTR
ncbi:hypothetical protein [Haloarcula onubensis]|uniref:Small CPxCG-related zinc finger protein n=1 Tax=Haloarcula onubensis TaxID=2950539 RepID=A0ABU2FJ14_9EURY|nr:hypothetical protein [Halomicroarcula sp. S3CR25-11]MDS0280728.1 hypothetical protein [Halomicroarcula sp. S3CR25-11]